MYRPAFIRILTRRVFSLIKNDLIKKDDERDVDLPSRFTAFFPSASSLDEYD
jgi:hypothetical protein